MELGHCTAGHDLVQSLPGFCAFSLMIGRKGTRFYFYSQSLGTMPEPLMFITLLGPHNSPGDRSIDPAW
jgi:hypothetical protein